MQGLGEKGDIPNMNIKSVLIDGLRIYEDSDKAANAAYIQIHGPVGSMVVRRVEVLRNENVPVGGALVETRAGRLCRDHFWSRTFSPNESAGSSPTRRERSRTFTCGM